MDISLFKTNLGSQKSNTLVVFAGQKGEKTVTSLKQKSVSPLLDELAKEKWFCGQLGQTHFERNFDDLGAKHVLFVGLGSLKDYSTESLRCAAAHAAQALSAKKIRDFDISLAGANPSKDQSSNIRALVEGLCLSVYRYDELMLEKTQKKNSESDFKKIRLLADSAPSSAQKKGLSEGLIAAEATNFAKRLGDAPGSHMTPDILAKETQKAAKGTTLKVTIWDQARLKKEKFGGLLGVSKGSDAPPRFIIMEYKGAAAKKAPIAFVGKGLTFDSGGISIKPSAGMDEMKYDMCGGASVIATMVAIAKLKLKVNVLGFVPASENMPGPSANKPGDVCVARNGKSFEIGNTDAEGRLILADALSYASEQKPQAMFDAATLTGAIVVALGNIYTGVFSNDQKKLVPRIQKAADSADELVWNMPLHKFHTEDMKGTHADLSNISTNRGAGSSTAAAFLQEFVGEDIPWAHFDIAGTAWNTGGRFPYCQKKSASGSIVRTFIELARSYS